jgi:NADH-quinone oxidoreductase subunit F
MRPQKAVITICNGTVVTPTMVGVTEAFREEVKKQGLGNKIDVRATGCHGFCERGPLVVIKPKDILYQRVRIKDVPDIVNETVLNGKVIERMLYSDRASGKKIEIEHEVPFYKGQKRLILGNNGLIDPTSNEDYFAVGGIRKPRAKP